MLVNKLGDTMKKVASRALSNLNSLLYKHPRMKLVVIDEVERLLFRNNISKRAQYYGVCFLNSINLQDEHPEVACKLINVYVAFFKGCIKTVIKRKIKIRNMCYCAPRPTITLIYI